VPTKEQRGLKPPSPARGKKGRRTSPSAAPLQPPKKEKQQTRQYKGAAVLRRNTFPNYLAARTEPPKGVSKKAERLLRTDPKALLKPKNQDALMHVIKPGGVLEPRIARDPVLLQHRKDIVDAIKPEHHTGLLGSITHAVKEAPGSAWESLKHPVNMKALHQFTAEASSIYKSSTGKPLNKKEQKTLKESGFPIQGSPVYLKVPADFSRIAIGLGPGMVLHGMKTLHDPVGAQVDLTKAIGESFKESATHPIRQFNRPGGSMELGMNVAAPFMLGAGSVGRAVALRDLKESVALRTKPINEGGRLTPPVTPRRVARALLRPPPVAREITFKGQKVHPASVKSSLGGYIQKSNDYVLQKALDNPDNMVASFLKNHMGRFGEIVNPEARFGRMMRTEKRVGMEVRGGLATYIRGSKQGPTVPARLKNIFTREDVSAIRKSKRGVRMTAAKQKELEPKAADIVASSHAYTMHEIHHDLWHMGEPGDWWMAQSKDFERGGLIAIKAPPETHGINPDRYRSETQLAQRFEEMFPKRGDVKKSPDKYRFVPLSVVEGLHPYGVEVGGGVAKAVHGGAVESFATRVDKFTQAIRAGRFIHPGYAQNSIQNRVLHLSQAGPYIFRNVYKLRHEYPKLADLPDGQEVMGMMEQGAGAGHAIATRGEVRIGAHETQLGRVSKFFEQMRTKGEKFWHEVDDRPVRMMALLHELQHAGYTHAEQWRNLFVDAYKKNDPKAQAELFPILQRARKEAVDYSEMTPHERALLRRAFTAYGWTRGATTWTARFPFMHPVQAQYAQQLGQQGADRVDEIFSKVGGMIPEWLEGTIPVTGGNSPLAIETSWLPPTETPAALLRAVPGLGSGLEPLSGEIAPGPSMLMEMIYGQDRYGQKQYGTDRLTVPAAETLRRFRPAGNIAALMKDKPTSTVVGGPKTALFRTLGIPIERIRDLEKTGKMGLREYVKSLPRPERIKFQHDYALSQLPHDLDAFDKAKVPIPEALIGQYKGDLDAKRELDLFQYEYAKKHKGKQFNKLPAVNQLEGTLQFLHKHKHLTTEEVNQYQIDATALAGNEEQLKALANSLWAAAGVGQTVNQWKALLKQAKPHKVTKKQ